ncbi:hypothetical protein SAMN05660350_03475 [Geodermatophilus obscurus]|uniref:Uncharacterized protein n=1 Tax=Geodermatophilus obscurus TaxID=1861 RepID=A0A1M7ULE0_9ACTN|nr:hypothetical protein [Geodermatophilus obscurus]SHN83716.1 hypothetical protein SAMN05660350_03475 [Geodermatophilus obscurus]
MTVHVGEVSSSVELQGVPGQRPAPAAPDRPAGWDERQRHRELAEEEARLRARTAGGGFDG